MTAADGTFSASPHHRVPGSGEARASGKRLGIGLSKSNFGIRHFGALARALNGTPAQRIDVTRVRLELPRLPAAFVGLRIAHLSDLHLDPEHSTEEIRATLELTRALEPDVVVVTGDFVSRISPRIARFVERELTGIHAPLGAFAVLGNHDHWTDPTAVARAITRAGLRPLLNEHVALERGGEVLYLAGVDDINEARHDLVAALDGVPEDGCAILLAHEPDFADEASIDRRIVLQLSGHTHGGQIRLPGYGPVMLPRGGRKYVHGLYRVGEMIVYTSRGIGACYPPVRFNCRSELVLHELALAP